MRRVASELAPGDVLAVPGHELHDDLAGLTAHLTVRAADPDGAMVKVTDTDGNCVWWPPERPVEVVYST